MMDAEQEYAAARAAYGAARERLRCAKAALPVLAAKARGEREQQRRLRDSEILTRSQKGATTRELALEYGLSRDWVRYIIYEQESQERSERWWREHDERVAARTTEQGG